MQSVLLKVSRTGHWLFAVLCLSRMTLSAASSSNGQMRLEQEVLLVEVVVGLMGLHHGMEVEPMVSFLASGIGRGKVQVEWAKYTHTCFV
jgi:hypothetical protein